MPSKLLTRSKFRLQRLVLAVLCGPLLLSQPGLAQKKPRKPKERADVTRFRARVEGILAQARVEQGHWAVLVMEEESGQILYSHNSQRFFTPASNTKLFTTVFALAQLGPEYRFRTSIETRGQLDPHGRLRGELVLVGRGDPNLSNRKFPFAKEAERDGPPEKILAELADAVVAQGVKQIEGDVVADDSFFVYDRYPTGWTIDDMTFGYGAPVTALAVNDNTVVIEVRPGERADEPAWFGVEPWADFYQFQNEIITGAAGSEPARNAAEGPRLGAQREPGSRRVVLRGSIPLDSKPLRITLAVEEPAEHAAQLLKRLLEARGVRVYGAARARHTPGAGTEQRRLLAEHTSVPLVEAVKLINKISQNLHAEMLLRVVAREKAGEGSTAAGLKLAQEFFKSIGIEEGDVATHDGSGLSRRNLVTPRATLKLLVYAAKQPWVEAFLATLPVAGEDGTLAERMKDTPAAGRIRAKTGTLGSVNAFSGYATTLHDTRLVFSMFGNHHNLRGQEATDVLDAICVAMVEEIGGRPPKRRR